MRKIETAYDARRAKQAADDRRYGPGESALRAKAARLAEIDAVLKAHPEIGVLWRRGRQVYYVTAPTYVEADRPEDLTPKPTLGNRLMPGCECGAAEAGNFDRCRCD